MNCQPNLESPLIMKKSSIAIALFAGLSAVSAFAAGEADYAQENRTPFVGTFTRAQVQAELSQAQRDGTMLAAGEALGAEQGVTQIASTRDRSAVRAEAVAAAHSGTFNLKREAFVNSVIPMAYANGSLARTQLAAKEEGAARL